MGVSLYNTLTRTIEPFQPLRPPAVGMYVCGPTVYDDPHIGHARSAYVFDVLRRYLEFKGFTVTFVRNVTDVDDKIIQKAQQTGETAEAVATRYLARYHEVMDRLGIRRPDVEPKATEHVNTTPDRNGFTAMTDLISKLLLQGAAYEAGGDVYFAVRKCPGYGRLSNRTVDELQSARPGEGRAGGARVEPGEHPGPPGASAGAGKHDPLDFALWKAAKPGEPAWSSPWGQGRPGWHIECSTMSTKYLGDEFDIHGGGVDLVFPHHENEIAQAQAAGKPFARCWVHNGLLTVKGEKMSKSLGNFITVEQALEGYGGDADALKMFFLSSHYRSPVDYTAANVRASRSRLEAWVGFLRRVETHRGVEGAPTAAAKITAAAEQEFVQAMDDDLNTPRALAALDKLVNAGMQATHDNAMMVSVADALLRFAHALGLLASYQSQAGLTPEQAARLEEREHARARKDFAMADRIREEFAQSGWVIEDTAHGPVLWKKP